jgi:hypothetical protein
MIKRVIISLLGISVAATLGTEAIAATCILRSSSGTCKYWSGSHHADIVTDSQGGPESKARVDIVMIPDDSGIAACVNSGAKKKDPSGQNLVIADLTTPENFFNISCGAAITRNDINGGIATVAVDGCDFSASQLVAIRDLYCANTNYTVPDAVMCSFEATMTLSNRFGTQDQVLASCSLPNCETLPFIPATQHFDVREFICTYRLLP